MPLFCFLGAQLPSPYPSPFPFPCFFFGRGEGRGGAVSLQACCTLLQTQIDLHSSVTITFRLAGLLFCCCCSQWQWQSTGAGWQRWWSIILWRDIHNLPGCDPVWCTRSDSDWLGTLDYMTSEVLVIFSMYTYFCPKKLIISYKILLVLLEWLSTYFAKLRLIWPKLFSDPWVQKMFCCFHFFLMDLTLACHLDGKTTGLAVQKK